MEEFTEEKALESAVQGNTDAFSVLYERYVTRIYNYIYYRTGNGADAEDLTARVFFKAFGHIGTYKDMGLPLSAWLYRIAHNLVANWHRDNSRRNEVALEDQPDIPQKTDLPEVSLVEGQDRERLLQVIRRLSPERQQLVILKFVEHLGNAEISIIMRRSEGAIKSLYHRTLLQLRDELSKFED